MEKADFIDVTDNDLIIGSSDCPLKKALEKEQLLTIKKNEHLMLYEMGLRGTYICCCNGICKCLHFGGMSATNEHFVVDCDSE
jgi:hypothetical protein